MLGRLVVWILEVGLGLLIIGSFLTMLFGWARFLWEITRGPRAAGARSLIRVLGRTDDLEAQERRGRLALPAGEAPETDDDPGWEPGADS